MDLSFWMRGMVLLLFTALAGFLSSVPAVVCASWGAGGRGALFGAVLGLGVLVTDRLSRERLLKGQYPDPVLALVVGFIAGMVAAGVLVWQAQAGSQDMGQHDFSPPVWVTGVPVLAVSLLYAILLHGVYAARSLVKRPNLTVLLGAIAAGAVCGAARGLPTASAAGAGLGTVVLFSLSTSIPFCLLWMLAVRISDPGWSPQRWARSMARPGTREKRPR